MWQARARRAGGKLRGHAAAGQGVVLRTAVAHAGGAECQRAAVRILVPRRPHLQSLLHLGEFRRPWDSGPPDSCPCSLRIYKFTLRDAQPSSIKILGFVCPWDSSLSYTLEP